MTRARGFVEPILRETERTDRPFRPVRPPDNESANGWINKDKSLPESGGFSKLGSNKNRN